MPRESLASALVFLHAGMTRRVYWTTITPVILGWIAQKYS